MEDDVKFNLCRIGHQRLVGVAESALIAFSETHLGISPNKSCALALAESAIATKKIDQAKAPNRRRDKTNP